MFWTADDAREFGQYVTWAWLVLGYITNKDYFMWFMSMVSFLHFNDYVTEWLAELIFSDSYVVTEEDYNILGEMAYLYFLAQGVLAIIALFVYGLNAYTAGAIVILALALWAE